MHADVILVNN